MPDITESDPAPAEDWEISATSRSRLRLALGGGERVISALTGGTFLVTAIAMAVIGPGRDSPASRSRWR